MRAMGLRFDWRQRRRLPIFKTARKQVNPSKGWNKKESQRGSQKFPSPSADSQHSLRSRDSQSSAVPMSEARSPQPPTYYSLLGAAAGKRGAVQKVDAGLAPCTSGRVRPQGRAGSGHSPRSCPQHNEAFPPLLRGGGSRSVPAARRSGGVSPGKGGAGFPALHGAREQPGGGSPLPPGRGADGSLLSCPPGSLFRACPPAPPCCPGMQPAVPLASPRRRCALHRPCPAASGTRRRGLRSGLLPPPRGLQPSSAGRGGPALAWEAAGSPGKVTGSEEPGWEGSSGAAPAAAGPASAAAGRDAPPGLAQRPLALPGWVPLLPGCPRRLSPAPGARLPPAGPRARLPPLPPLRGAGTEAGAGARLPPLAVRLPVPGCPPPRAPGSAAAAVTVCLCHVCAAKG